MLFGLLGAIADIAITRAYQLTHASLLGAFQCSQLLWGVVARIFLLARSVFCFGFGWHCLDRWQRLSHSTSSEASACYQFTLGFNASFSGKSMKFFVNTADVSEIRKLNELGIVDGVLLILC